MNPKLRSLCALVCGLLCWFSLTGPLPAQEVQDDTAPATEAVPAPPDTELPSGTDAEDWRASLKVLRVGVLASGGATRELALLEPFREHLETTLAMPVELVPARNMRSLIDAIVSARVDYAPLSASAFATGWALCRCLEPIAVPLAADGTSAYHSIAVVRASSGIRRLADMQGKSVVFSDVDSVAGYLAPVTWLREEGIVKETYFGKIGHAAGPVSAVAAMLRGDYDVAFGWSTLQGAEPSGYSRGTLASLVARGALDMQQIRIIWKSAAIPHPPQVIRSNLPDPLKALLRATLFDLAAAAPEAYDAIEPYFSGGFVAASRDSYAAVLHAFAPR